MILAYLAVGLAEVAYELSGVRYLIVERQWSQDLAVRYPSVKSAEQALTESFFIDGLAEEDALDIFLSRFRRGGEVVVPPEDIPMWMEG